jgi:hypothetical protein
MSKKLIKKIVQNYQKHSLSKRIWIRWLIFPMRIFHDFFNELCFDVYQISGDQPFFFITSTEIYTFFIKQFCNDAKITKTGEIYAWHLKRFTREHDKVIIDMHGYLAPLLKNGIITVRWVRQELDLSRSIIEITKPIREKKKIFQFNAEISTDISEIKFFYEKIYTPYIKKRYKNALIQDYEIFKKSLLKNPSELILIKKNGLLVGGACCRLIHDRYYWRITALIDDLYLKEGAMAAILYYSILRAKEKNAKIMDFGESRPFLSDGVLCYKKKWGTKIVIDKKNKRIVYLKNLKKEGLIILEERKLKALIFSEKNAEIKPYSNSGLELKIVESRT